jgi:hypothetical protein
LLTTANLARIQLDKTGKLAEGNGKLVELTRANELA